jgi:predicted SnoaL-like aldol condensation-catalyzing enzyme
MRQCTSVKEWIVKMSIDRFAIGLEMDVSYPSFQISLRILSATQLRFEIKKGPFARTETVDIQVVPLGNGIFAVSWQEKDGATVTNVQDYDRNLVHSLRDTARRSVSANDRDNSGLTRPSERASDDRPQRNKALVLEAMTSLFQRHDASAVERLYADDYIQHNPSIPQGRDALQCLEVLSPSVYYEPGLIIAEDDLVAIHGRIRGWADEPQVVVDIFRVEGGKLVEHWDVLQTRCARMQPPATLRFRSSAAADVALDLVKLGSPGSEPP